ncbi:flavin reductase family protein [Rhodococcus erythropolis]|uniref:flavin reductase family protein n=1 Tax=Rhodococcus erythropolis TaxID=1833 RepID=UPI0029495FD4|nr:flavin reductase family protein [Rhodococcus erythropolis]MDV6212701.1 flavin reductase family protein [Rhodococcus erythropolis]
MSATDASAADEFRRALGHVPTPVAIVTAVVDGVATGMTVGSFASVSLTPRMITFFVDDASTTWPKMSTSPTFVVNVLGHDNGPLCRTFSGRGDRFADVAWRESADGDPILLESALSFQCRMHSTQRLGDHVQVVGTVTATEVHRATMPLVYHRSTFLDLGRAAQDLDARSLS